MNTYIYSFIIVAVLSLGGYTIKLESDKANLKIELLNAHNALDAQNKALDEIALDLDKYKGQIELDNKNTIGRYDKVSQDNLHTCEQKLKQVQDALDIFYKNLLKP